MCSEAVSIDALVDEDSGGYSRRGTVIVLKIEYTIEGVRTNPSCKATEQTEQVQLGEERVRKNAVRR